MKILLVGKNGFVGKNLIKFLKKKFITKSIGFDDFITLSLNQLSCFDVIINCSIKKNYIFKKYNKKYDNDRIICKKISLLKNKLIIISTRKIYKVGTSLTERSKIILKNHHEKNKYKTEIECQKLINNRLIILRPSNIIGFRKFNDLSVHKTFIDYFIEYKNNGMIPIANKSFKDFITIVQFSKVVCKIIENIDKCKGAYNVSINKKIYVKDIVRKLLKHSKAKTQIVFSDEYSENFTLNNKKLLKLINYKISKNELMQFCENLSKYI